MSDSSKYTNSLIQHIENSLRDIPYSPMLFSFKKHLLEEMQGKADDLIYAGLSNEKVLVDLLASEYGDLKEEYALFRDAQTKRNKEKKFHKLSFIACAAAIPATILIYLAFSFITQAWHESWLIIVGGVFAVVIYLLSLAIRQLTAKKPVYQTVARIMLAMCVALVGVYSYLFVLMLFPFTDCWVIVPFGVFFIYVADAIYAHVTNQPMRIINYLVYVPAAMPMVYVVLGGLHLIPWHPGWLLMPLSVVIDILIIASKLIEHSKYVYKGSEEND